MTPPKAYYDALLTDRMMALDAGTISKDQILWVNFNGATIKTGYDRGQSFLPCNSQVTIQPSGFSAADQSLIMQYVAQYYSNAGAKLALTFDQPASGDYTEMVVGGSYKDLGCAGGAGVLGISPFDVGNANPNDIGFVFVPSNHDIHIVAETIAHEAGHTFGLDHTNNIKDIMYPTESIQVEGFAIGTAESTGTEQNGPALLQQNIGSGVATVTGQPVQPTTPVPSVPPVTPGTNPFPNGSGGLPNIPGIGTLGGLNQLLSQFSPILQGLLANKIPGIGTLPAGIDLKNPQAILSVLTVALNGSIKGNGGQFDIQKLLGMLTNPKSLDLPAIIASLGLGAGTGGASSMIQMIIAGVTGAAQGGSIQNLDLTKLLGISGITNPGQLIALIPKYGQIINGNVPGANGQALMDFVKMAIAQAMAKVPQTP